MASWWSHRVTIVTLKPSSHQRLPILAKKIMERGKKWAWQTKFRKAPSFVYFVRERTRRCGYGRSGEQIVKIANQANPQTSRPTSISTTAHTSRSALAADAQVSARMSRQAGSWWRARGVGKTEEPCCSRLVHCLVVYYLGYYRGSYSVTENLKQASRRDGVEPGLFFYMALIVTIALFRRTLTTPLSPSSAAAMRALGGADYTSRRLVLLSLPRPPPPPPAELYMRDGGDRRVRKCPQGSLSAL